ncbi:MAG: ATP-grasp fold amidoligase family protein [Coriobacteriaceae bacterium]|nr:ATP-grasp fold amidoligase family protein [Coriobacteriaceae bacterium]
MNLENPRTYNEMLQRNKLYGRNTVMPKCCNKNTIKKYVESRSLGSILSRLIWQGFDRADIPFDDLPGRFAIKALHGSTFNIICTDKSKVDREGAARKYRSWIKAKFLPCYGEWFYGVEQPRVIIEEYDGSPLRDYQCFCFGGTPWLNSVCSDRGEAYRQNIFDISCNLLGSIVGNYLRSEGKLPEPACLERILSAVLRLSEDFTHVRIDFFVVSTYRLGERMGDWLKLPERGARVA